MLHGYVLVISACTLASAIVVAPHEQVTLSSLFPPFPTLTTSEHDAAPTQESIGSPPDLGAKSRASGAELSPPLAQAPESLTSKDTISAAPVHGTGGLSSARVIEPQTSGVMPFAALAQESKVLVPRQTLESAVPSVDIFAVPGQASARFAPDETTSSIHAGTELTTALARHSKADAPIFLPQSKTSGASPSSISAFSTAPGPAVSVPAPKQVTASEALAAKQSAERVPTSKTAAETASSAEVCKGPAVGPKAPTELVQFVGLFNSGNHLMISLVKKTFYNFERAAQFWEDGLWTHLPPVDSVMRKLSSPYNADEKLNTNVSEVNVIAMVRSPFSWIRSMSKAAYDLQDCKHLLSEVCYMQCETGLEKNDTMKYKEQLGCPWRFRGLVGAYKEYLYGYLRRFKMVGFKSVSVVPYERLVMNSSAELVKIADATGLAMCNGKAAMLPRDAQKTHGDPRGRFEAITRIKSQEYIQEFSAKHLVQVCDHLSPDDVEGIPEYVDEVREVCAHARTKLDQEQIEVEEAEARDRQEVREEEAQLKKKREAQAAAEMVDKISKDKPIEPEQKTLSDMFSFSDGPSLVPWATGGFEVGSFRESMLGSHFAPEIPGPESAESLKRMEDPLGFRGRGPTASDSTAEELFQKDATLQDIVTVTGLQELQDQLFTVFSDAATAMIDRKHMIAPEVLRKSMTAQVDLALTPALDKMQSVVHRHMAEDQKASDAPNAQASKNGEQAHEAGELTILKPTAEVAARREYASDEVLPAAPANTQISQDHDIMQTALQGLAAMTS